MKKDFTKIFALLLAVMMLVGCFAGCAKQEAAPEAEKPAAEAAAPEAPKEEVKEEAKEEAPAEPKVENVVLKVAGYEDGHGTDYLKALCEGFEKMFPNVTVELTTNPKIDDIIRPQMVSGESPDVFFSGNLVGELVSALLNEDQLLDMTALFDEPGYDDPATLREQIAGGILESSMCDPRHDGTILAAPVAITTRGMIYNQTLFEEHGWEVPETWDEFFALGDKAKEEGIALFGYPGTVPSYMDTLVWPALASVVGADQVLAMSQFTEGILTTPEATKVFENIGRIGAEGYLMEGCLGMNHTQAQSEFLMNKCLFYPCGDWLPSEMADAPHAEGFKYACAAAPVLEKGQPGYTRTNPSVVVIPKMSKNPETALAFIKYLYTDEAVKAFTLGNMLQVTKDAAKLTNGSFDEDYSRIHEVDATANALAFAWAPDREGSKIAIKDVVFDPIADVMAGKMSGIEWRDIIEDAIHRINAGE